MSKEEKRKNRKYFKNKNIIYQNLQNAAEAEFRGELQQMLVIEKKKGLKSLI